MFRALRVGAEALEQSLKAWKGRGAGEVATAVERSIFEAAPEVASSLRKLWSKFFGGAKGVVEEGVEGAASKATKIVDELAGARNSATELSGTIHEGLGKAKNTLDKAVSSLHRARAKNLEEMDRISRSIMSQEKLEPAQQVRSVLDALKERRSQLVNYIETQNTQLKKLSQILETSISPGQERAAINLLEQGDPVLKSIPGVLKWRSQLDDVFRHNKQIMNLTSKNLGSDTKFLQEFMSMSRMKDVPSMKSKLQMWSSNPKNFQKLEKLMSKDKIFDILQVGRLTTKQKIFGITLADQAKRLGIGAGIAGAGAFGAYSLLGNINPMKIFSTSGSITNTLGSIETSGAGAKVLDDAKRAVSNIERLSSDTNTGMGKEGSEKAAANFISGLSRELEVIAGCINQWDFVVAGSSNKEKSVQAGLILSRYAQGVLGNLNKLGAALGTSIKTPRTPPVNTDNNINDLQAALGLEQTGSLDSNTVAKLQSMEEGLNARQNTTKFTGLFYNPETKRAIPLNYLQSVYKKFT